MQRLVGLKGRLLSHRLEKKRLGLSQKKPENEKFDGFQKIQTPVSKSCLIQNSKRMRKKQEIENRLLFSEIQIPSRIPINSKILVFKCRMKNSTFDSISKHSSFQKHLIFVFLQTSRIRSKSRKNFESVQIHESVIDFLLTSWISKPFLFFMVNSQIHDLLIDVRDSTDTPFSPPRTGVHGVFSSTTELTFNLKKTALPAVA